MTLSSNSGSLDETLALSDTHKTGPGIAWQPDKETVWTSVAPGLWLAGAGYLWLQGLLFLSAESPCLPQTPEGPTPLSQSVSHASLNPADTTRRKEKCGRTLLNTARSHSRQGRVSLAGALDLWAGNILLPNTVFIPACILTVLPLLSRKLMLLCEFLHGAHYCY